MCKPILFTLYPGREPCPRIVLGLVSIKPVSGRLLKAGIEQGRVTTLFRRGIKKNAAAVYKSRHFTADSKSGAQLLFCAWHFCENDLERGLGRKEMHQNCCVCFFLAWWVLGDYQKMLLTSDDRKWERNKCILCLSVAESTVQLFFGYLKVRWHDFLQVNWRYKKQICLTTSRVDINNSNFIEKLC